MQNRISTNLRKWISLIAAVLLYFLIHEGAHLICALIYGVFESVRFMGVGIQIVINDAALSHLQLAVFCIVGSIASLIAAYVLVLLTDRIVRVKSKYGKAMGYTPHWSFFSSTPFIWPFSTAFSAAAT